MAKRFGFGMAGCLIVVIALLGTVLGGFCTDVTQQTRAVTDYDYVTDVTGLFDITPTPEYIPYNPAANYVGYTANTVTYTPSGTVSPYRYVVAPGTTTTTTKTVAYGDTYASAGKWASSEAGTSLLINYSGSYYSGNTVTWQGITYNTTVSPGNPFSPYVTTLREILNSMSLLGEKAEISVSYGSSPIFFTVSGWTFTDVHRGDGQTQYIYSQTMSDNNLPTSLTVDLSTYAVTAKRSGTTLWSGVSADNIDVVYRYSPRVGNVFTPATNASMTLTATTTSFPIYGYADPEGGVTFGTSPTTWSNDYQNNEITITVAGVNSASNNLTITAGTSAVTITKSATGTMIADLTGGVTDTRIIGHWNAAQLRINATEGTLSLTPISSGPSFTAPVEENGTTYTWTGWYSGGSLSSLSLSSSGTSLRWGITSTTVFLDTYGVVMQDPAITITDYFPEMTDWRLNFYSFAVLGDSVTINGVTYPVSSDHKITITITDGEDTKTYTGTMQNIYITNIDGELYFTWADTGQTVDLGETVSENVAFGGRWYFTTGLFEVTEGTETYLDWNLDGRWHATNGEAVVMFLGLLALGIIVGKGLYKIPVKSADGLIVIMAAFIALTIGGMMI